MIYYIPHLEALLHLGALALTIKFVYLGLDHLHKSDSDLEENIKQARTKVDVILSKVDNPRYKEKFESNILPQMYDIPEMRDLWIYSGRILVNETDKDKGKTRRKKDFPLLEYFENRLDKKHVLWVFLISLFLFFIMTAIATWWKPDPQNSMIKLMGFYFFRDYVINIVAYLIPLVSYIWFCISISWIIYLSYAGSKLYNIEKHCAFLVEKVKQHLIDEAEPNLRV